MRLFLATAVFTATILALNTHQAMVGLVAVCDSASPDVADAMLRLLGQYDPTLADYLQECARLTAYADDYDYITEQSWLFGSLLNHIPKSTTRAGFFCRVVPVRLRPRAVSALGALRFVLEWSFLLPVVVIVCAVLTLATSAWLVFSLIRLRRPIRIDSPVSPYSPGQLKADMERLKRDHPLLSEENEGHKTLAHVRQFLERFAIGALHRRARVIRDIGGSPKRNKKLGDRLHVCFPDLTSCDHAKRQNFGNNPQVHYHTAQACTKPAMPAFMSYVDFHLSSTDLGDSITAPTIIITHDYGKIQGDFDWFGGEAVGCVTPSAVFVRVRMGDTYAHGYHLWQDEGIIVGTRSVAQYIRLGDYGKSSVFLAYPATGNFGPSDPRALKSSTDRSTRYLTNGQTVEMSGPQYIFRDRDRTEIGRVLVGTIVRAAFTLFTLKRTETYAPNAAALVRGRFTQDKQELTVIPQAAELVAQLADDYALDYTHRFNRLSGDVASLGWVRRQCARIRLLVQRRFPSWVDYLVSTALRIIVGDGPHNALVPWAWVEHQTPNYEVHVDELPDVAELGRDPRIRPQPFRTARPSSATGPAHQQQRQSPRRSGESSREPRHPGPSQRVPPSSQARPTTQGRLPVQDPPRMSAWQPHPAGGQWRAPIGLAPIPPLMSIPQSGDPQGDPPQPLGPSSRVHGSQDIEPAPEHIDSLPGQTVVPITREQVAQAVAAASVPGLGT